MPSIDLRAGCSLCRDADPLHFDFSYAFQPIVDVHAQKVFAHDALVRGPAGEPASSVLSRITAENRYSFDQACREKAIRIAASLDLRSHLSINFLPNAIYRPEVCIRSTLQAADQHRFPVERIIFETVEGERVSDGKWLAEILSEYKRIGFKTAIDDFGAGFAGLNLLADFQPDMVKLDMALIRDIDRSPSRRAIVAGVVSMCEQLSVDVIAEGIETDDEAHCLSDLGIRLMQGYWFGRPRFECGTLEADIQWTV
ncbi:EAL domain-containing protein [Stenotrophomonas rhizophila]|uniref:EAL domain-containing protein (Putative c-di-GMP-specific phosphodiesterase class I) n=1 Tax=Stenotrophomonas rhizophila TaxID=216778 RepID=A0AAW5PF29_9GAMM|nr:EAL domain-containing protein [Stenotrophomonas rhizophila]MCS4279011.1 EAL domain-containing protein (putative c-di-GMP-specific phosphodiesterase class I) [Stenotrophomonas rhizophila]